MTKTEPIIGDLSIVTEDGTELTASSDLQLAWKWAEHEHGDYWQHMSYGRQCSDVADALAALREAGVQ